MLRQHRQAVFANFGKAALDGDCLGRSAFGLDHLYFAIANGAHARRMTFQHATLTLEGVHGALGVGEVVRVRVPLQREEALLELAQAVPLGQPRLELAPVLAPQPRPGA